MSGRRCTSCGSGAEADASFCWLCGYPLATSATPTPPPVAQVTAAPPVDGIVWMIAFILVLLVMLAVAAELALVWPGLLIPYAVVLVPVLVLMSRIVYVQRFDFWKSRAREQPSGAPPQSGRAAAPPAKGTRGDEVGAGGSGDMMGEVVTAIAIGLGSVLVVLGLTILLAVAAFIVLLAICLGMLTAYGQ